MIERNFRGVPKISLRYKEAMNIFRAFLKSLPPDWRVALHRDRDDLRSAQMAGVPLLRILM
jgi:hypothetical protein